MKIPYGAAGVLAMTAALLVSACAPGGAPVGSSADTLAMDAANVRAAADKFKRAIGGHDLETILSYYVDDGVQLAENGPAARSAAERRAFWQAIDALPIASDIVDVSDRIEVARSGELAVQYGEFRQLMSNKTGATSSEPQKFMNAWRKQPDGSWKVSASMSTVKN